MGELWVEHTYFVYIYRVLGSFVILTGLILYAISIDLRKYTDLYSVMSIGFVLVGLVMMVTGITSKLALIFYFPDFVFCFFVAWFIYGMKSRLEKSN